MLIALTIHPEEHRAAMVWVRVNLESTEEEDKVVLVPVQQVPIRDRVAAEVMVAVLAKEDIIALKEPRQKMALQGKGLLLFLCKGGLSVKTMEERLLYEIAEKQAKIDELTTKNMELEQLIADLASLQLEVMTDG
jgi:hypothetical protein